MKRIIALVIALASLTTIVSAFADENMQRFQPYTDVDISVLESEGFTCSYDEMDFTAELSPKTPTITWGEGGTYGDTYKITFDIKVIYAAGEAIFVPRLIFYRQGWDTYFDNRMDEVLIKNGENRYRIDVSGVSRYADSKSYSATEQAVEPMGVTGLIMLKDIADGSDPVSIRINSSRVYEFTQEDKAAFADFCNGCEKAGVFDQEYLLADTDHYHIITLFNAGSEGTEDNTSMEEIMPSDEE